MTREEATKKIQEENAKLTDMLKSFEGLLKSSMTIASIHIKNESLLKNADPAALGYYLVLIARMNRVVLGLVEAKGIVS